MNQLEQIISKSFDEIFSFQFMFVHNVLSLKLLYHKIIGITQKYQFCLNSFINEYPTKRIGERFIVSKMLRPFFPRVCSFSFSLLCLWKQQSFNDLYISERLFCLSTFDNGSYCSRSPHSGAVSGEHSQRGWYQGRRRRLLWMSCQGKSAVEKANLASQCKYHARILNSPVNYAYKQKHRFHVSLILNNNCKDFQIISFTFQFPLVFVM